MENHKRDIDIIKECLGKKERILNNLLEMTNQQAEYLAGPGFDMDVFDQMIDVKDEMIDELDTVDDGFEATYERIGAYLKQNQESHALDIRDMQNRIREITRLSVSLQALEERNRAALEKVLAGKNKEIHSFRKGSEMVNNYFQAMSGYGMAGTSTLDKKK